jgi:hypothetical protein
MQRGDAPGVQIDLHHRLRRRRRLCRPVVGHRARFARRLRPPGGERLRGHGLAGAGALEPVAAARCTTHYPDSRLGRRYNYDELAGSATFDDWLVLNLEHLAQQHTLFQPGSGRIAPQPCGGAVAAPGAVGPAVADWPGPATTTPGRSSARPTGRAPGLAARWAETELHLGAGPHRCCCATAVWRGRGEWALGAERGVGTTIVLTRVDLSPRLNRMNPRRHSPQDTSMDPCATGACARESGQPPR